MNTQKDLHWFSTSSGIIELQLSLDDAEECSQGGRDASPYVLLLLQKPYIGKQTNDIDKETLTQELSEYGAWEDEDLQDHYTNLTRLLWLAACDIIEEHYSQEKEIRS